MADNTLTPKYQPDPRLLQARVALASHLGLAPDDVTISIGRNDKDGRFLGANPDNADAPTEDVVITVHKPGYDIEPDRLKEELRAALAQLKPLADVAQLVPEVQLATKLHDELQAATAGTGFNQKFLEWPGFNPEMHKHDITIRDYAVENVRSNAYGVEFDFRFPAENRGDQAATVQKFAEVQNGRVEAIKEILLERVIKYARHNIAERGLNAEELSHLKTTAEAEGKTPEQLVEATQKALQDKIAAAEAQLREQFAALSFNINTHQSHIKVDIRSPEQAEAYKKAKETGQSTWKDPENADALRNTNPLTSLTVGLSTEPTPATDTTPEKSPQLHKALARSFLFDKDKNPIPDFAQVAGRKDIQIAIAKEMMKILPHHPEKEAEFRKMLDSPLFKQHELWHGSSVGQADVSKPFPMFEKVKGENDTVSIAFPVRKDANPDKNQIKHLIEGLAGISAAPVQEPVAPEAASGPAVSGDVPQVYPPQQQPVQAAQAAAEVPAETPQPEVAAQQPAITEQTAAASAEPAAPQTNPGVYSRIAQDIIKLHNQRQGWSERAKQEQEARQTPNGLAM